MHNRLCLQNRESSKVPKSHIAEFQQRPIETTFLKKYQLFELFKIDLWLQIQLPNGRGVLALSKGVSQWQPSLSGIGK